MKIALLEGDLQDGMLAYYLEQAKFADANVEARIEREPFDWRQEDHWRRMLGDPRTSAEASGAATPPAIDVNRGS